MHLPIDHIRAHERWLMERILEYAKARGYTAYTSTLLEAWRVSVAGLTDALAAAAKRYGDSLPEFSPQQPVEADPVTAFGVHEARRHRERGVNLSMFLGLYKYYRYAFMDLLRETDAPADDDADRAFHLAFVERCFDAVEIAFCAEWTGQDTHRTMTDLQDANRRITNEKNKYHTLFESLDRAVFLVDEVGRVDDCNAPAAALLGIHQAEGFLHYAIGDDTPHELRGAPLAELLPWLDEPLEALLCGATSSVRMEFHPGSGLRDPSYQATMTRMRDVSGKYSGAVVMLDDITERKDMERLKEDVDRITRHDLKGPLSGMLGMVNALLVEDLDEDTRASLAIVRDSGYAMLENIDRSLDIFRMETGAYVYEPEPVDMRLLLRRLTDRLGASATGRGVALEVTLDGRAPDDGESGPFVAAEDILLASALGNLMANAVEASSPGDTVRLAVRSDGADCTIAISNPAPVPEAVRETFFEKYATHGKRGGTGLGTYSAKLMVETMGGEVDMRTAADGTRVTVRLPLTDADPAP